MIKDSLLRDDDGNLYHTQVLPDSWLGKVGYWLLRIVGKRWLVIGWIFD
jgi:hypothetical protein